MAEAAPATAARPDARLWRITLALFLAGFATFSLIYSVQPLLSEFAREFRLDAATSSLALSATTGALAISILAMGAFSETLGRRGLMFGSMCAAALLNLGCAVAPTWPVLLAARGLEGLVLGGVPAVAMAYLAEEAPPSRLGFAMGLYVSGTAFGGMTGRVAMGVMTQLWSWRVALGVVSAVDLAAAVAFLLLLPSSRHFVRRAGLSLGTHLLAWRRHLRQPRMSALFLVAFLAMGAFVTVYNYVGFRLAAPPYALDQAQIGLIFLIYLVGMAASSDGLGYWLVASDGGIFNFGDARFFGSAGGAGLVKPAVGIAPTPDGGGYWITASDGGIFNYGDANFYGSEGGAALNKPVVGVASAS